MPRARSIILFLVAGAIINILVAWSVCITPKSGTLMAPAPRTKASSVQDLPPGAWARSFCGGRGDPSQFMRTTNWRITNDFALWDHRIQNASDRNEVPYQHATNISNFGLPFRSLRCRYEGHWIEMKQTGSEFFTCFHFDAPFAAGTLPYAPIWPGFVLNTLLYASLAALLSRAPRAIQRARRRRSDRCITCGYPRTGLDSASPCPECGNISAPNR